MSVQSLEISTNKLLTAVISLPKSKFEKFVADARKLKKREETLIAKLPKFDLSADERKIYQTLLRKFRDEEISKEESKQLARFTDKLEGLNVERIKCLTEIAKIRQKSLKEVMKELKVKPQRYE